MPSPEEIAASNPGQDSLTFVGNKGNEVTDSIETPPEPYAPRKRTLNRENGARAPKLVLPESTPHQDEQAAGDESSETSPSSPSTGQQPATTASGLAQVLAERGFPVDGMTDEEIMQSLDVGWSHFEQSQQQAQRPRTQEDLFQQPQSPQQAAPQQAPQQETEKSVEKEPLFKPKYDPLDYKIPDLDPTYDNMVRDQRIVFNQESQMFEPAKGLEDSPSINKAATELNEWRIQSSKPIQDFQRDPVEFINRAVSSQLSEAVNMVLEQIQGTAESTEKITKQLNDQRIHDSQETFFEQNAREFFEFDGDTPKMRGSNFVPSEVGREYMRVRDELSEFISDPEQLHQKVLTTISGFRQDRRERLKSQQYQTSNKPQDGGQQSPAEDSNRDAIRKRIAISQRAREEANSQGGLQVESGGVPNPQPVDPTMKRKLDLRTYVRQHQS